MRRSVAKLRQQTLHQLDQLFGPWLLPGLLAQADEGPNSRERVFTLRRLFFAFLYQVLNPGCPCREVVRQVQALFALAHRRVPRSGTGSYCQARDRLPVDLLARLRCAAAARAAGFNQRWQGLDTKLVDGTGLSMPDTAKNQRAYPQLSGQEPGCGFPLMKVVAVFSLASGAVLDYAKGNKHQHELGLLYRLIETFKPKDFILGDRGFCAFWFLALLSARQAFGLFRLHQARSQDFRRGKRLGKLDRLLTWNKPSPSDKPGFLSKALWKHLPQSLSVRMVRFSMAKRGFRNQTVTLLTTLLDPKLYPAEELAQMYLRRWRIELWLRDIKTSMGMEVLRCQTPKMVHKELEMHLIAYNLIRCLMNDAAAIYEVPLERLSFKGSVDAVRQFSGALSQTSSKKKQKHLIAQLMAIIAEDLVPERPGRNEPRALKRRPKPFQLLNRPRRLMNELRHRRKNRRKSRP